MRNLALALLILACLPFTGWGKEKKPAADDQTGLVKIEVRGKLVRKDHYYCVQAKNPDFDDTFLVQLVRTEDKNQNLDEHIGGLEGQVVIVRGVLRFTPRRQDGPELGIPIRNESQIQKAAKE